MSRPSFEEIFEAHSGRPSMKWGHYFKIYDAHFDRFRGAAPTVLEIGIRRGGSLQIWRDYFGPCARVVGADIDPSCRTLKEDGFEVFIIDQMHAFYSEEKAAFAPNALTVTVNAVHFYDSIVVIEKSNRYDEKTGVVSKREGLTSGGAIGSRSP